MLPPFVRLSVYFSPIFIVSKRLVKILEAIDIPKNRFSFLNNNDIHINHCFYYSSTDAIQFFALYLLHYTTTNKQIAY